MVTGLIPGSIGETSVIAIAIGAVILLWTGVASWKTMLSVFVGGAVMGWIFNTIGPDTGVAESGLSRRYDVGYLADEYLCTADRLRCSSE